MRQPAITRLPGVTRWPRWILAVATLGMALQCSACGSQRNTGQALVYTGAMATAIGATSASASYCGISGCFNQKRRSNAAAVGVAATGAAAALAGYALMEAQ